MSFLPSPRSPLLWNASSLPPRMPSLAICWLWSAWTGGEWARHWEVENGGEWALQWALMDILYAWYVCNTLLQQWTLGKFEPLVRIGL